MGRNRATGNERNRIIARRSCLLSGAAIIGVLAYAPFGVYSAIQERETNIELANQKHVSFVLETFDENKDGTLDRQELYNYVKYQHSLIIPDKAQAP